MTRHAWKTGEHKHAVNSTHSVLGSEEVQQQCQLINVFTRRVEATAAHRLPHPHMLGGARW